MIKLLPSFFLLTMILPLYAGDPVKFTPVGNSITAGEHYRYPALDERTGYRKELCRMLINSGYKIDFVDSQVHGKRSENEGEWYDWNCEAYPGVPYGRYHPNDMGNAKMAKKMYEELVREL
jgi:hypothetical protein